MCSIQYAFVIRRSKTFKMYVLTFSSFLAASTPLSSTNALHENVNQNAFPTRFIANYSICSSNKQPHYPVTKKVVYITLPYKRDHVTSLFKRKLNSPIKRTYNSPNFGLIEETDSLPASQRKVKVPCFTNSISAYKSIYLSVMVSAGARF